MPETLADQKSPKLPVQEHLLQSKETAELPWTSTMYSQILPAKHDCF